MSETKEAQEIEPKEQQSQPEPPLRPKKRLPRWCRIVLRVFLGLVIAVLLVPVLLYIPPVQDFAVRVATDAVYKSTGMKIGIGRFRLLFPLDVSLRDVYVIEASGDTMVRAKEAVADLKLLPLLRLDVDLNRLSLSEGYYRMMSPDSSMLLAVRAGYVEVDDKSSVDLRTMTIDLNRTLLRDGRIDLVMDVWKKKQQPVDTAKPTTPIVINSHDLHLENFSFSMSMLPTIDTLDVAVRDVRIADAKVDLGENLVKWGLASLADGHFTYLAPTPEYVRTHPAPPSEPSDAPPMRIMGDSISVDRLKAHYGVAGARPQPGFDPQFLELTGVAVGLKDFYNESSTVRLPITRLQARERCGLQIMEGSGTVGIDSLGLTLDQLKIATLYSRISATADVPFALMALEPSAPMSARAEGRIGLPDIEAFMPALKTQLSVVPARKPIDFEINARGSLANLQIPALKVEMPGVVRLNANGTARNPLDYKRMTARLTFDGALSDPQVADKFIGEKAFSVPAFTIEGTASADGLSYGADFKLLSDAGDLAAKGHLALTPEDYAVNVDAVRVDVGRFLPELGIGRVSATVDAHGHGFNPLSGTAVTDAIVNVSDIEYHGRELRDIRLAALLTNAGDLTLDVTSANPGLDLDLTGSGTIHPDDYRFDLTAQVRDANLWMLGLTDTTCFGSGVITLSGAAQPSKWVYNADLNVQGLEWHLPGEYIHLPDGLLAEVRSDMAHTSLNLESMLTSLRFEAGQGPESLISAFTRTADLLGKQLAEKNVVIDRITEALPRFSLALNASGRGLLDQLLEPNGIMVDTLFADIRMDSLLRGDIAAFNISTPTADIDTVTLNLNQRGSLIDYRAHVGNRPGTLDEFARVNLNGYLGDNRISAFLNQWNLKGEQGYRIGLTAAYTDSVVTAHVTPLKSTVAYMPWTFNADNYVDFNIFTKHLTANLTARGAESSITARTQQTETGNEELYLNIDNLHIQDFLRMWAFAPPIKGDLNTDLHIVYEGRRFSGNGSIGLKNFVYERTRVGDFDLDLNAGFGLDASTDLNAALRINGSPALSLYANLVPGSEGLQPDSVGLSLTRFPLKVANPFLEDNLVLNGYLNGDMKMEGSFMRPRLNGKIAFDSVTARIPMAGATLRLQEDHLDVRDNVLAFHDFNITAANANPIALNGTVNASDFSNLLFDLKAKAENFQLIRSDRRSGDPLFGKVFLDLDASVTGPMHLLDIEGTVDLLGTTDATYLIDTDAQQIGSVRNQDIVKFVNFNDTVQTEKADSVALSPLNMKVNAQLTVSSGTQLTVLIGENTNNRVEVSPTANLKYHQNYMGDMTLNGVLTLGEGFVRYNVPVIGEKLFNFNPSSTVTWNGPVMNPVLNISATDLIKANVNNGNNSRLVNFLVTLNATNTLSNLQAQFNLSTNDDVAIQNELQSMSADQRQTQAMNLLLYGQYSGQNATAKANSSNFLYGFLESELNSLAAKYVRGVDLTFGVDQYNKITDGNSNTETSYSYQVSKSLFNNRFKINIGGNYSTDSADDEIAQNLVSDISFEYMLKQTQNMNMSVQLFRHTGFESILEGEITEMGVGFLYKRRLQSLRGLFHFSNKKKKKSFLSLPEDNDPIVNPEAMPVKVDQDTLVRGKDDGD